MKEFITRIFNAVSDNLISGGAYYTILKGVLITAAVTLIAWAAAAVLGIAVSYLMCYDRLIISRIGRAVCFIMRSTPAILLVWLFYYCVFGGSTRLGFVSAGVAIGVYGGGHMAEILSRSVRHAQEELSGSIRERLRHVYYFTVVPQALEDSLFDLKRLSVLLLQWSAVSGYISVNDLTAVMYGIGHRTMYPFFSIAFAAVCYLIAVVLIEWIFELIGGKINKEA